MLLLQVSKPIVWHFIFITLTYQLLSLWLKWDLIVCVCVCVQYDFVELLDGSRLIAKEKRGLVEVEGAARKARSVNVHEAEFIRFLDSGTWHLAFYNDGKNTEQVSYNTIIIGKPWLYTYQIMLFL